jgi:hypothetical protein
MCGKRYDACLIGWALGALLACASVVPAWAAAPIAADGRPYVPDDSLQVADNVKSCGIDGYTRFYEHNFQTAGSSKGQDFDLMVVGLLDPSAVVHGPPLVWVSFGPRMEILEVVVTVPGWPIERLTRAQLLDRWPHVCDLLEEVHRRAGASPVSPSPPAPR